MTPPPKKEKEEKTKTEDGFNWLQDTTLRLDTKPPPCEMTTETIRVHSRNKVTRHLIGQECWLVAYQHNIDFIREYFEELGFRKMKVIIGKSMSISWKRANDAELFAKIAKWQLDGDLEVRVAKNNWVMHGKWFLCWDSENSRFLEINGSANPTLHGDGRKGKQSNRETKVTILSLIHI